MSVNYNNNIISVSSSHKEKNLLVYAHPGDKITFDFDISTLEKEVINGDLVIRLLNGGTITIVNFGLMTLDNRAPVLEDINTSYNPFSVFGGYAYLEESGIGNYVISRKISSPDNNTLAPGETYPTSKAQASGDGAFSKEVGDFMTPEQSAVPEFAPLVQDYIIKTFQHAYDKTYESPIVFSSKNNFRYNEVDSDVFPVKLLLINPKITPEYGAFHQLKKDSSGPHKEYEDLTILIGGGRLKGDEFAYLMYTPETINYSNKLEKMWFDGPKQSEEVIRYFHVGVPSQSISITQVVISGLPPSIRVPEKLNPNLEVKPLGSGAFEINVRGSAPGGVEVPITYPLGMGGEDGVFAAVGISYEGVQAKTGDLIKGGNIVYFEFKPVRSEDDVSNFTKFNTYTFSTLRDPLIIHFGVNSDVIKGGKGDYTYYGTAGDNLVYGGEATEIFHLGSGNNKFYAGIGNDTVDVDDVKKDNRLYLSDGITKADEKSTNTYLDDGKVWFTGKYKGKDFKSSMKDFSKVFFDIADNNQEVERDDIFQINSTVNLKDDILIDLGKGNNLVKGNTTAMEINFKVHEGVKKLPFITTNRTAYGAIIRWGEGNNKIVGSTGNDLIVGINDNEKIYFDGNEGNNTADYSNVTLDIVYDAATGALNKSGSSSSDEIVGIQTIIGSKVKNNTFYGAVRYKNYKGKELQADIKYIGGDRSEQSTLSYEHLKSKSATDRVNNGVTIDMSDSKVIKKNTGGIDYFYNIDNLISSNNNDTIIVDSKVKSNNFNGLGGFNTIDYSKLGVDVVFNVNQGAAGTVTKGSGTNGVDIINNFRHFIGSPSGASFVLNAYEFPKDKFETSKYRFVLEGRGGSSSLNKINYSSISNQSIVLDLKLDQEGFLATLYKDININQNIIGIDNILNVGVFSLSVSAKNLIYMYDINQLNFLIDGGSKGDNTISFEKCTSSVKIDFNNSDYKNNLNNIKLLKLGASNNEIIMGSGFFAEEIDGGSGISTINFSHLTIPIITEIDLSNIELLNVNISSKTIKVRNFQHIIATNADDKFTIKFDLKDVDVLKGKDINIDGGQGYNTINFKDVKDSSNEANGLNIDISSNNVAIVKDTKGNNILKFAFFNSIIGSQGNDIFILPAVAFSFTIDGFSNGPNASNAVSYQMYTKGVYITELVLSKFRNIQKIIGSQGNDVITLTEKTNLQVDGFAGFNSTFYKATTGGEFNFNINVDVLDDDLTVTKNVSGNKTVDHLRKVNLVSFAETYVTQGITFIIKNKSNSSFSDSGKLFLSGSKTKDVDSKDKVDYSGMSEGVTLNLDVQGDLQAAGYWINVVKSNNNIDYFKNIGSIKLSDKSKVYVYNSIAAFLDTSVLNIDGISDSTLSFAHYVSNILLDVKDIAIKLSSNLTLKFKGFTSFEGAGGFNFNTNFIADDEKSYNFNGLSSNSTLSYANVVGDMTVTVKMATGENYNTLNIKKSKFTDNAKNIISLEGSKGNTSIFVDDNIAKEMSFLGNKGSNNSINYSKINNVEILSFMVSKEGIIVGRAGGLYNDKLVNFNNITGSKGNSRFEVDSSLLNSGVKYVLNGGGGINSINLSSFAADLTFRLDGQDKFIKVQNGSTTLLDIYNMHYIWGSSNNNNNFILGNIFHNNYFESKGIVTIYGGKAGKDILDLKSTNKSLILEPLSGRISLNDGSPNSSITIVAGFGIHTINLGDGDHQLDISSKVIATTWKVINGGAGKNSISFSKMLSGIVYELDKGMQDVGITITNFTGVTGSRGNDTFILSDASKTAIMINGNGGSLNTLDFSRLTVHIKVDIPNSHVTRGQITDTVLNMQVFKTGSGGAEFISQFKGSYQFLGHASAVANNSLSYIDVEENITFNFITQSVVKGVGNNYDRFLNISKIIGGKKNNNFLFVTEGLPTSLSTIILDGGNGTNNIVNLSQLKNGINYKIDTKSFTVSTSSGNKLTIKLEKIHQVIGTAEADFFIFSDSVNNFMANGGNNKPGVKDTADLSGVSTGITVDFSNRSITYGNNRNSFLNIDRFIGSNAGNNTFKGLSTNTQYEIDGGASPGSNGNTLSYSGASVGLALSVINGVINLNKGGLKDTFRNIQNLELSNLEDRIIFNKAEDLNVYRAFKKIDGSYGNNYVEFSNEVTNSNNITIDIAESNISIGSNSARLELINFNSWVFGEGSKVYKIIVGKAGLTLKTIVFSNKASNNILDIKAVTGDLSIIADQGSSSVVIINPFNGTRTNIVNLNTLFLGDHTYSLTYTTFNPAQNSLKVIFSANTKFNLNIGLYNSDKTVVFSNSQIQMGAANFQNVNILEISRFANKTLSLELRDLTGMTNKETRVIIGENGADKSIFLKNNLESWSTISLNEGNRYSIFKGNNISNGVIHFQHKSSNIATEVELTSYTNIQLASFNPAISKVIFNKENIEFSEELNLDLSALPIISNTIRLVYSSVTKDYKLFLEGGDNKPFFTVDISKAVEQKKGFITLHGSAVNNVTLDLPSTVNYIAKYIVKGSYSKALLQTIIINLSSETRNQEWYVVSYDEIYNNDKSFYLKMEESSVNRVIFKYNANTQPYLKSVSVVISNTLKYVDVAKAAAKIGFSRYGYFESIFGVLNINTSGNESTISGNISYLGGSFNFVNSLLYSSDAKEFGFSISLPEARSSVQEANNAQLILSNNGIKVDFSTLRKNGLGAPYISGRELKGGTKVTNSFSFGDYVFDSTSFVIDVNGTGNLVNIDNGISLIVLKRFHNISLEVVNAKTAKHAFTFESSSLEGNHEIKLGSLEKMILPTVYQIFVTNSSRYFESSGKYPIWNISNLNQADPYIQHKNFNTYNNMLLTKSNNLEGDFIINGNNDSVIQWSDIGNSKLTVSGFNLFVGKTIGKIRIHELSKGKPFAILASQTSNDNSSIDFSNVRDGGTYAFRLVPGSGNDNFFLSTKILVTTPDKGLPSVFNPSHDSNFKLYATVIAPKKLFLTSGTNIVHGVIDAKGAPEQVIGGFGNDTFVFNVNPVFKKNAFVIKINSEGFKFGSVNSYSFDCKPVNANYVQTIYKNIKTIQVHNTGDYSNYIEFDSGEKFPKNIENVYFLTRGKNEDGSYCSGRGYHLVNTNLGRNINMFINEGSTLITRKAMAGVSHNISLVAKDGSLAALDTSWIESLAIGLHIDFSKFNLLNNGDVWIKTIDSDHIKKLIYPKSEFKNYKINISEKLITISPKGTGYTIKLHCTTDKLKVEPLNDYEYNEFLIENNNYLELTKEEKPSDTFDTNTGSKIVNGTTVWISESKYLESLNKQSPNNEYWEDLNSRIESALREKRLASENTNEADKIQGDNDSSTHVEPKLIFNEEVELEYNNFNHTFVEEEPENNNEELENNDDTLIDNTNDNIVPVEEEVDNESSNANHSYIQEESAIEDLSFSEVNDGENYNNPVSNISFDLSAVLESAKEIGKASDSSNILDELGASNISSEILEDMYQIDEANSMGYTIDTGNNSFFSDGTLDNYTESSNTSEQQKNKVNN